MKRIVFIGDNKQVAEKNCWMICSNKNNFTTKIIFWHFNYMLTSGHKPWLLVAFKYTLDNYRAIYFAVSKVWDWNSISVKLSCKTKFFLFSLKSDIDENGSLNYRTMHKNYHILKQKWWWSVDDNFSNKNFFSVLGVLKIRK